MMLATSNELWHGNYYAASLVPDLCFQYWESHSLQEAIASGTECPDHSIAELAHCANPHTLLLKSGDNALNTIYFYQ